MNRLYIERKVLVFDNYDDSVYLDQMMAGVEDASLVGIPFTDPKKAAAEMDRCLELGAIVTTLGWQDGGMALASSTNSYPAHPIITRSNQLPAPRAVVSDSKRAGGYIRGGTSDTVIPLGRGFDLSTKVTTWLHSLVETGLFF